ncbi:MAG: Gfo/Idh/MocA family oxidoreductase [Treponema sp.]|jgi:predicted dehydrogenase|nr:Gfo/Idh/MocA family oxidoreductase [Treponema sp.]
MDKVPVFLIGSGGYGKTYLDTLLADPENRPWNLAGLASPDAQASPHYRSLRERGIPIYENPSDFFKANRAAGLLTIVSSPIHTHYRYTLEALENGSAVLCEKPVCADKRQLDELQQKERETGLFVAVGYQRCFNRDFLAFKKDIMAGLFGKPLKFKLLNLPRRGKDYYARNAWAGNISFAGERILDSPLQNACGHEIQLMLFFLGEELDSAADLGSLEARLWKARKEIENFDAAAIKILSPGGTEVYFYTAHCVRAGTGPMGEFQFEKARAVYGGDERISVFFNDGRVKDYNDIERKESQMQKLFDCVEALRGGPRPSCTLKTARSHLDCVIKTQEFPIIPVTEDRLEFFKEDGEEFLCARGLGEAFREAYEHYTLPEMPSEIPG